MPLWADIAEAVQQATGKPFDIKDKHSVGGGSINSAYMIESGDRQYFIKLNHAHHLDMFEAEAQGLEEIAHSHSIHVPAPVTWGVAGNEAYLVMEYLSLGHSTHKGHEELGRQLASMHKQTCEQYGWKIDNTIGSTPQPNTYDSDWLNFWREKRLGFQLQLAADSGHHGYLQDKGNLLMEQLDNLFNGYTPVASLLHGDLWSGNYAFNTKGQPVIFDPAVYYGDREADIAMTELFGGFDSGFYAAYNETWPLDPGYSTRKTLYNLYHIINHLNLFGGGYRSQAEHMIDSLLAQLR